MKHQTKKDIYLNVPSDSSDAILVKKFVTGVQGMLKWFSLVSLTLQNACLSLLMRHVRTQKELFLPSTAVLLAEILKLILSFCMLPFESNTPRKIAESLRRHIWEQPLDTFKVAIPSFVYLVQNNLLYVGATHLDAATCQVTYQLKILTTALLSVLMLHRRLRCTQWVALVILFCGVALVQLEQIGGGSKPSESKNGEQSPLLGFLAIVMACCLSGFAGVYFEKILKSSEVVSIWIRNIQLCLFSIPMGFVSVYGVDAQAVHEKGFFFGYNGMVWTVIFLQGFGGILVAVVVKYADNILKGFSTSAAIVLAVVYSALVMDTRITAQFVSGAVLVIASVFLYGYAPADKSQKK